MKSLKEFFHMIVAAVICFGMKVITGRENRIVKTVTETNEVLCLSAPDGYRNLFYDKKKVRLPLKKVFYWKQGPGDRLWKHRYKRLFWGKKIPEEKDKVSFYLVPE